MHSGLRAEMTPPRSPLLLLAAACWLLGASCEDEPAGPSDAHMKTDQPPSSGSGATSGGTGGGGAGSQPPASGGAGGAGGSTVPSGGASATGGNGGNGGSGAGAQLLFDRGTQGPKGLHASERYLYWYESNLADGPRVLYAAKDGSSEPQVLAQTEPLTSIGIIQSDAQYVYWVESQRVLRAPHGGGQVEAFPLGRTFTFPYLAIHGTDLYVTDLGCFHVARVPTSSFDVQMLRDDEGEHAGGYSVVVADDDNVYCSSSYLRTISAFPKAGGASREIVSVGERYGIGGVVLAGDTLYYLRIPQSLGDPDQSIWSVPVAGGQPTMLAAVQINGGGSALLHDTSRDALFWASGNGLQSNLYRYDLGKGELSTPIESHNLSGHLALDSTRLYFSELDPSGIFSLSL